MHSIFTSMWLFYVFAHATIPPCDYSTRRSITASEAPDMSLLTSTLVIVSAVAKRGSVSVAGNQTGGAPAASVLPVAAVVVEKQLPELAALAEGGAWGAVYDALKGPIMACAVELQSGVGKGGKKLESAVSVDLAECLNNMARCAEVRTRVVGKSEGKCFRGARGGMGETRRFGGGKDGYLDSSSVAVCGNSKAGSGVAHMGGNCCDYPWNVGIQIMTAKACAG